MPDTPEEQVRRLLAAARVDDPVPPDVVERLDGVLADLTADRARAAARTAAARRSAARRHRFRVAAGAAAAVVLVGAFGRGLVYLHDHAGSGVSSESSSAGGRSDDQSGAAPATPLPALRPGHLRADILQRTTPAQRRTGRPSSPACVVPRDGQHAVAVTYAGRLAALLLDPIVGATQPATVQLCDGVHPGRVVRRLSLPAP